MVIDIASFAVGFSIASLIGTVIYLGVSLSKFKKIPMAEDNPLISNNPLTYKYEETTESLDLNHSPEWYVIRRMAMDEIEDERRVNRIIEDTNCTSIEEFIDAFSEYLSTFARSYADNGLSPDVFDQYTDSELYEIIRDHVSDFIYRRKKYTDMLSGKLMTNSIDYQQDKRHKRPIVVDHTRKQSKKENTVDVFKQSGFYEEGF